jgi:hypothetical protein
MTPLILVSSEPAGACLPVHRGSLEIRAVDEPGISPANLSPYVQHRFLGPTGRNPTKRSAGNGAPTGFQDEIEALDTASRSSSRRS